MKNKTLKYISTICFAILALWNIVNCFPFTRFNFWGWIIAVGSVLIVIALLTATPILSSVGFALWAINSLYCIVVFGSVSFAPFPNVLIWAMDFAVYVLLMIASIKTKSAKPIGFVAAILEIVRLIAVAIYRVSVSSILYGLLLAASAALLGLTYQKVSQKFASPVEKLMRLESLLDEGAITQEEFDAKKKQLLGL